MRAPLASDSKFHVIAPVLVFGVVILPPDRTGQASTQILDDAEALGLYK